MPSPFKFVAPDAVGSPPARRWVATIPPWRTSRARVACRAGATLGAGLGARDAINHGDPAQWHPRVFHILGLVTSASVSGGNQRGNQRQRLPRRILYIYCIIKAYRANYGQQA